MSDSNNHSNPSTSNISNVTGQQITNPPANPLIAPRAQSSTLTSSIGTHAINGGLANGNDQVQRPTPTSGTISSDHQARSDAPNDDNDPPPSAVMTVENTDNHTVRSFHAAFHTDDPHPSGPFTLASDLLRPMTARDREDFGLLPDASQPGMASHNYRSANSEPDGFDLFETPSTAIPPGVITNTPITLSVSQVDELSPFGAPHYGLPAANSSRSPSVSQAADFSTFGFHASGLRSYPVRHPTPVSGATALSSHPLREANATATMFDSTSPTNEGPSNTSPRPSHSSTDLGLRSESVPNNGGTPHSQPNPASDSADRAASTNAQDSPNTVVGDAQFVNVSDSQVEPLDRERFDELAPPSLYSEDEAAPDERTTVNSSVAPERHHVLVASRHPVGRGRTPSPSHGSTPNNNTPRDDGRPVYLSDYLREASPSDEDREVWNGGRIIPPGNTVEDRANNTSTNAQATPTNANSVMRNATPQERERLGLEGFYEGAVSNGQVRASPNTTINGAPSANASDLRLGPISGESTDLIDHMVNPSAETREMWNRAFTTAPVEVNTPSNTPPVSPTQSDQHHSASSAANRSLGHRNRRAPRTGVSLRRLNTEETEAYWNEFE